MGAFAIYYREPRTPTTVDQNLIEQFTHIAGIAIERAESEACLKRSEALLNEAQRISSTGSFSWRVSTNEITWSEEAYRMYGLDPAVPVTPAFLLGLALLFVVNRGAAERSTVAAKHLLHAT